MNAEVDRGPPVTGVFTYIIYTRQIFVFNLSASHINSSKEPYAIREQQFGHVYYI
jgi:hypothetical protein